MTNLNTAIARHKGWVRNPDGCDLGFGVGVNFPYLSPEGNCNSRLPDFEHDARLYMSLFEEMPNPCIRKYNDEWLCIPEMRHSLVIKSIEEFSKDIGTAICQAYCKLKGIEVVG